ncbi:MAG: diguanylate cyclase [Deltaproteobacteria bacterium]|nr:diguanylate cyclase [Deltaproteobacteria bacterium]
MTGEAFYRKLLDEIYDGVYFVDVEGRIVYWNKAAEDLTGYAAEEMMGSLCQDGLLEHLSEEGVSLCGPACPMQATLEDGQRRQADIFLRHRQGHLVPVQVRVSAVRVAEEQIIGAVVLFHDSTPWRELRERLEDLERLALVDPLTGLPNRRYLESQLDLKIGELERYGWPFGVLFLDVDNFQSLNESFGQITGDRVLTTLGRTLMHNARLGDLVGRWEADAFMILLSNVDRTALIRAAERYRVLVRSSVVLHRPHSLTVTVSLGGALADPLDTMESLLAKLEARLERAKALGRDCVVTA